MAQAVILPKQGLQMTEGCITKWLVPEGGRVEKGKPLFEMETDKTNMTVAANATGTLLKILHKEGDVVPVAEAIAVVGGPGEDISGMPELSRPKEPAPAERPEKPAPAPAGAAAAPLSGGGRSFSTPRARTAAARRGVTLDGLAGTGPGGLIIERDVPPRLKATDTARQAAALAGLPLSGIAGSGDRGRVLKRDVEQALEGPPEQGPEQNAAGAQNSIEIRGMRKSIFENMHRSLHTMAQANHRMRVDMSEAVRLRSRLKESGVKVGYTDILIKVAGEALMQFPILNSRVDGDRIILNPSVNMGFAVALDNGLIVPNIKNCQTLRVEEISAAVANLAAKAREGRLTRDEYTGGTFTVTNLGMYDIDEFTAIINPPEAAILAVGKIADTPVCVEKQVEIRPMMTLSLTYDHRIIDGAPAAQFLQAVKKLLQNPYLLI